jgi:glyoxylase-like metal-dependent hydrolase (beta-lactamase superfamily II)
MLLLGTLVIAGAAGMSAQPPAQPTTAEIEKVRDNLFMIRNGGGNTAVFITAKGVVLVDTKNPGWGERIMEKVRSVTDKPVTTIINTHTHGDHVGSNEHFPASVEFVAHENTKTNMQKMDMFQGDKGQFLPDRTYKDKLTLLGGADRIDLYHFGPGHTNGDTIVVFPALRVAHTGDLFAGPGLPLLDTNNGGTGLKYPDTLKNAAAGIKDVESVIPGHSAVTTWAAFVEFGEFNQAVVSSVRQAVNQGKTVEEAITGFTVPEKFKSYNLTRAKQNVTTIYNELKGTR